MDTVSEICVGIGDSVLRWRKLVRFGDSASIFTSARRIGFAAAFVRRI